MKFRVTLLPENRGHRDVKAEYFKVEMSGALVFRTPRRDDYPRVDHTFAPGTWLEITEAPRDAVADRMANLDLPKDRNQPGCPMHECINYGQCSVAGFEGCLCSGRVAL